LPGPISEASYSSDSSDSSCHIDTFIFTYFYVVGRWPINNMKLLIDGSAQKLD
jgi:hypothetical protein